jgi:Pyruvate/2-oxoacid:ferredoxin oxidoreductase delta subunit
MNYDKLDIYFFSGTGNAKRIALWFQQFCRQNGTKSSLHNVAKVKLPVSLNKNDRRLIVFISPIHGFNYPKISLDFIRKLPRGNHQILLMCTRAGMKLGPYVTPGLTGIAFIVSVLFLKLKGYRIKGLIPFDMPSNWLSIHPALRERSIHFIHRKNYAKARRHFSSILSGKKVFVALRGILQDILISPIAIAYYYAGRYALAKSFYATDECDNCAICIKQCPVKAIKMKNDRPYWSFRCESCMKCLNTCPKKAVEVAHGLFTISIILSSMGLSYLTNRVIGYQFQSWITEMFVYTFLFIFFIWILYHIQHILLRRKIPGKWIKFTSLSFYRWWGRYVSIPDHKWKGKE